MTDREHLIRRCKEHAKPEAMHSESIRLLLTECAEALASPSTGQKP